MSNYILDPLSVLFRLLLGVFIGCVIGIIRDESWQPNTETLHSRFTFIRPGKHAIGLGGVRTYILLSLLGTLLGIMYLYDQRTIPVVVACIVGIIIYISISYFLNFFDRHTLGLTTEIGLLVLLMLTFAVGAELVDQRIILVITILVSFISSLKVEFSKIIGTFTKKEIVQSLEFVALAGVVLPWLPNTNITLQAVLAPLGVSVAGAFSNLVVINPFQFWLVVVFISSLNFVGYFLAKIIQSTSSSLLVTAFLGGLVSSTSVTQFLAEKSNHTAAKSQETHVLTAAILVANLTSFIRIPLVALFVNPAMFFEIIPAMLFLSLATLVIVFLLQRNKTHENELIAIFKSPLALKPALGFGLLFLVVSIITKAASILIGNTGFVITALVASVSGLDAVTILTSQAVKGEIDFQIGVLTLLAAVVVNLLGKLVVGWFYGETKFRKQLVVTLGGIAFIGTVLLIASMIP